MSTAASPTPCCILHGTGGSGHSFLADRFAGVLFNKGQLLDATATT